MKGHPAKRVIRDSEDDQEEVKEPSQKILKVSDD
jgi:DNA topoisomerase-1